MKQRCLPWLEYGLLALIAARPSLDWFTDWAAGPLRFNPAAGASLLLIAGIGAGGFFIVRTIRRGLLRRASGRKLRLAVVLYGSVISLMLLSTLFTLLRPEWPPRSALLACVGGALFVFSDSLLAFDRFVQRLPHGRFWVMLTYHLGQIGLSSAMLVQAGILKLSAGG